ncbi:MAG: regulatory protein RecX [Thiotrichaceae bacterium]|nr:regulatory protein RecX [Thiotrichaceae bacterium]
MDNDSVKKELGAIRISAMNILAAREHSIVELRRKLDKKFSKHNDFDSLNELIEIVLQQLLDDNLLNEARFTECFIRSRINKGSGPVKIRHELMERGISSELSSDYLDDSYDFWLQHIEAVRNKRFGIQLPEDYKEQTKQSRFLYQRGFSSEFIRRLFNEV